jgi:hypothetical protein
MFAIFYILIGQNIDEELDTDFNCPNVNFYITYLMMSWSNSSASVYPPIYYFWSNQLPEEDSDPEMFYESENTIPALIMIYVIWFIWFLNQIVVTIILLNFLIAIISQSYEQVMSISKIGLYNHRRDLNVTCQLMLRYFNLLKPMDYILISCNELQN